MTRVLRSTILQVLDGDDDLYEQLRQEGLLPQDEKNLSTEHIELARLTQTLVRELEVNWPGVEIVLRMRSELMETRKQVASLMSLLQRSDERPR